MFKKRTQKSSSRSKPIRRDSESSDSDNGSTVVRKRLKPEANATVISKTNRGPSPPATLTKNEAVTKVDTLNQEIIDSERLAKSQAAAIETPSATGDSTYRGQQGYTKFIKPTSSRPSMDKIGPKKQSSSIKSTTVFDFARDICKDYKETGYCGYGDSCKFVHARDDFKAGWKLNRDWDISGKETEVVKEVEDIPFKCPQCKSDYKNPIKTMCSHYFCEKCFLSRYAKNKTCYICGEDTNGVATPAKNLTKLLSETSQSSASTATV